MDPHKAFLCHVKSPQSRIKNWGASLSLSPSHPSSFPLPPSLSVSSCLCPLFEFLSLSFPFLVAPSLEWCGGVLWAPAAGPGIARPPNVFGASEVRSRPLIAVLKRFTDEELQLQVTTETKIFGASDSPAWIFSMSGHWRRYLQWLCHCIPQAKKVILQLCHQRNSCTHASRETTVQHENLVAAMNCLLSAATLYSRQFSLFCSINASAGHSYQCLGMRQDYDR